MNTPVIAPGLKNVKDLYALEKRLQELEEGVALGRIKLTEAVQAEIDGINAVFLEKHQTDLKRYSPEDIKSKLASSLFFKINLNEGEKEHYFGIDEIDAKLTFLYERINKITYRALGMSLPSNFLEMTITEQLSILEILLIRESKRFNRTVETVLGTQNLVYTLMK